MKTYSRILMAVASEPWALEQNKLAAMMDFLKMKASGHDLPSFRAMEDDEYVEGEPQAARRSPGQDRKIATAQGNVAVLPIRGVLSARANMLEDFSGGMSIENLSKNFMTLVNDTNVKAIVLDIDSPGGSVMGITELHSLIMSARGSKPIIAQINPSCASAAFWLASAAEEIVITTSGQVGSVGVYSVHQDVSKYYEELGVKTSFIYAGKNKVEGNGYEPLGDEARAAIQASVDQYYSMFIDDLAKGRGISKADVEKNFGQGRMFIGADAKALGMVDRIDTMQGTLERLGVSLYPDSASRKAQPLERMKRQAQLHESDSAT